MYVVIGRDKPLGQCWQWTQPASLDESNASAAKFRVENPGWSFLVIHEDDLPAYSPL